MNGREQTHGFIHLTDATDLVCLNRDHDNRDGDGDGDGDDDDVDNVNGDKEQHVKK